MLCVFMPLEASLGNAILRHVSLTLNYPKTLKPPIAENISPDALC
jgi:hypothetical protein